MGEEVDLQEFTPADRTRHREKVHRCLDVFARMLREAAFDTDDPIGRVIRIKKVPFTVIGVMREPRDWLGSWYRYRQRPGIPDKRRSTAGMSFDAFIQAYCTEKPPAFANVGAQAGFLRPADAQGVDMIFRHDRIEDLVAYLENRLATKIILPVLNVSPLAPTLLTVENEALLQRFAAIDFALYASL